MNENFKLDVFLTGVVYLALLTGVRAMSPSDEISISECSD